MRFRATGRPRSHRGRPLLVRLAGGLALGGCLAAVSPVGAADNEPVGGLRELLAGLPADSLPAALRRFEAARAGTPAATEATVALGQLYYARGEYRIAAQVFARAAARMEPARKPEARYWAGLSWLAQGEVNQARAALDEVVNAGGPRASDALLARAQVWDLAQRPERTRESLRALLAANAGEVGPAALERAAGLADEDGDVEEARRARERLLREYPRSIEAAGARRALFRSVGEGDAGRAAAGGTVVVIGSFADAARARALAAAARAAGFAEAEVVSRGDGLSAIHEVRLGR